MKTIRRKNKKFLFTKKESKKFLEYFSSNDIEVLKLGISLFKLSKVYKHYKEHTVKWVFNEFPPNVRMLINEVEKPDCRLRRIKYIMYKIVLEFTFKNRYNFY